MVALGIDQEADEASIVCLCLLDDELEVPLRVALAFYIPTLLEELEDVRSGKVAFAGTVDALEDLYRAELGK